MTAIADAPDTVATTAEPQLAQIEQQAGAGAAWKLVGQAGVQCIRLVTVAILARLLAPADYGAAAIAIALAMYAPTVSDMAMGTALVQTADATRVARSTVFWATIVFGVTLSAIAAVVAGPIGDFLGDPRVGTIVAVGGSTFAICALASTNQAMYIRQMRFRTVELRYWLALVAGSAVAITAAIMGAGPWALLLQQLTLLSTFAVSLWWRAGWRPTLEFSFPVFKELGSYAARVAGGRWARLAELLALTILVGKLVGVAELGAWSFAMSTVILPLTVVAIPISEVVFSASSRLRDDRPRIAAMWLASIRILAAVILPLLIGLVVVAPDLIPVVFGAHWHVAVGIVQVLSIYVIVRCLQAWGSVVLDAIGRPEVTLWTQLAALCLTPIAVVVGSQWSIEAVAAGFVLGQLIAVEIPVLIVVLSELRVSPATLARRLLGPVTATLVMAAACLLVRAGLSALGVGMGGRAALTTALGALVYAVALWLLAPDIVRRAVSLVRRPLAAQRRRVLQT